MIEHNNKSYLIKVQEITNIGKQQLCHEPSLMLSKVSDKMQNNFSKVWDTQRNETHLLERVWKRIFCKG